MKRLIYNLKYSIRNLFYYFKTIWNDRSWDHSYILILLKIKLEKIVKDYDRKSYSTDIPYQKKYLRISINLLNKLIEDNFLEEEYEKLFEGKDYLNLNKKTMEKLNILHIKQHKLKKKHLRLLMLILEKRIEIWWD